MSIEIQGQESQDCKTIKTSFYWNDLTTEAI